MNWIESLQLTISFIAATKELVFNNPIISSVIGRLIASALFRPRKQAIYYHYFTIAIGWQTIKLN